MTSLCLVSVACLLIRTVHATRSQQRIIGGNSAKHGQFPFMVSIQNAKGHICGGSIISKRYVLTAAHCVNQSDTKSDKIYVGRNSEGTTYKIKRIILNPNWTPQLPVINDIALVKTKKKMQTNRLGKPISLPSKTFSIPEGAQVLAAGWGLTQLEPPVRPKKLQYLETSVLRNPACSKNSNIICVGGVAGHDMCLEDSGGPLVYEDLVVGVLSQLVPCAVGEPSFFTKVAAYRDWIDKNMAN